MNAAVAALHAAAAGRRTPAILNDLSVALLERAVRQGSASDLVAAFEIADEAARSDPTSPEASFNRALLVERLGLTSEAAVAWRTFLANEPDSSWSREAAENLRKLSLPAGDAIWQQAVPRFEGAAAAGDVAAVRAIVERHAQEARVQFEDELVGRWAEAEAAGDATGSERALRMLRTVADALRSVTENPLPVRTVETIDATADAPTRRAALIRGHVLYRNAIRMYRNMRIEPAEEGLVEAQVLLDRARTPFASIALFYRASSRSYRNDLLEAVALLDETERRAEADGLTHTPLYGHAQWVRGRTLLNRGRPYESLLCFRTALAVFERSRETESTAAIHDLLAWNYEFLGDEDRAWSHYVTSVRILGQGNTRRLRIILNDVADYATSHGRPRTALLFASALVALARTNGAPNEVARSLIDRARALHATSDEPQAHAGLEEARAFMQKVKDARTRANLDADLAVAETEIAATGDAAAVLASFDRAIAVVVRLGRQTVLPRLWIERARAATQARRINEAERSLREAIAAVEEHRRSVGDPDLQIEFAEEWYRAFDRMVELLVDGGRAAEALEYAERSRARVLVEGLHEHSGGSAADLRELARAIPPDVVVLVYATLERSTAVWAIRRESVTYMRLPLTRSAAEQLVAAASDAVSDADPEASRRTLGALHDAILRPVAGLLTPRDRVIFAPDGALQSVPFSALYDRARGRWLVEDHATGVVPSMHVFVAALARDRELASQGRDRILVVGDPAFDSERFPDLPRLHAAASEARRVAALYRESDILVGTDATRAALLSRAAGVPIVHIAAHALVNARHPAQSALVLAREPEGNGVLYASEVDREVFSSARLVVLAACRTAASRNTQYEGPLGLARSFLAASVPEVLATLWDVEDSMSAELLVTFHRRLQSGEDALAALRNAQLALIHHPSPQYRHVQAWAGVQLIGGFLQE